MIDHRSYAHNLNSYENNNEKNSSLYEIRIPDFCDTGAVLYQLSYQATAGSWPIGEFVIYP